MNIRAATVDDVDAVVPLASKTVAFHDQLDPARFGAVPGAGERYRGWLTRLAGDESAVFLVAEQDGRVVGFIIGVMQGDPPIYRAQRIGFLHDLWVEKAARRRGVGQQLVQAAVDRFRALGAEQVRLDTAAANKTAQRLFARAGFRPAVIEMLAELRPEPTS